MTLSLLLTLCAAPAQAAWTLAYSGTISDTPVNGTPSTTTIPPNTQSLQSDYTYGGPGSVTASITITYTWTGTGTPPTKLPVLETGLAGWTDLAPANVNAPSGSCSDGLGDSEVDTSVPLGPSPDDIAYGGSESGTWAKQLSVTSGVAMDTVKISASCTGQYGISCGWSFSVGMPARAVPVNFRQIGSVINPGDGTLAWNYHWDSSDGNLNDLTEYYVHEYVTYGNPSTGDYNYPAPFTGGTPDPAISPADPPGGDGPVGAINDTQDVPGYAKPYVYGTYTATQYYMYDDLQSGVTNIRLAGPWPITRVISAIPPAISPFYYSVSKQGATATIPLN